MNVYVGDAPLGFECVELKMRPTSSSELILNEAGDCFESIQIYTNDGRIDGRRSRYAINGRKVTRSAYEKARG
jgi:hypothetical protein